MKAMLKTEATKSQATAGCSPHEQMPKSPKNFQILKKIEKIVARFFHRSVSPFFHMKAFATIRQNLMWVKRNFCGDDQNHANGENIFACELTQKTSLRSGNLGVH